MSTYEEIERHLYRALTNGRYAARSETVAVALRDLGKISEQRGIKPHEVFPGLFSRETWRRWHLAPGKKNRQDPANMSAKHRDGLLKWLRSRRITAPRRDKIRQGNITMRLWSNYENCERVVGSQTLDWTAAKATRILTTFLDEGVGAAARVLCPPTGNGLLQEHFDQWLNPDADGSAESYEINSIDLTQDPSRGSTTRRN